MDPSQFPISTIPLNHSPYGPLKAEQIAGINKGKVAVVTGGGNGIGKAISVNLANSGANVAILDLEMPEETVTTCNKIGIRANGYLCDVTNVDQVKSVFQNIENDLGPIDILVNNVGKFLAKPSDVAKIDEIWRTIEINFKSTLTCTWEVLPRMRQRQSGCIINMASRAATVDTLLGMGYNCAKAAVVRFTSLLQLELETDGLGEKVHTYALHPGGVLTGMGSADFPPGVIEKYPFMRATRTELQQMLRDSPDLCGATCAYLAAGRAKAIRGRYFDCRQDIERVCGIGRSTLEANGLYSLKIDFLQGYSNEP